MNLGAPANKRWGWQRTAPNIAFKLLFPVLSGEWIHLEIKVCLTEICTERQSSKWHFVHSWNGYQPGGVKCLFSQNTGQCSKVQRLGQETEVDVSPQAKSQHFLHQSQERSYFRRYTGVETQQSRCTQQMGKTCIQNIISFSLSDTYCYHLQWLDRW